MYRGFKETKRHCVDCNIRLPRKTNSIAIRCHKCNARLNGLRRKKNV
jgi:ribosomal protein L34E